jgi:hypothetical protein
MEVDVLVDITPRQIDGKTAETRDAAHERIDDGLDECAGYRSVYGIAAALEDFDAGFGRLGLRARYHPCRRHENLAGLQACWAHRSIGEALCNVVSQIDKTADGIVM